MPRSPQWMDLYQIGLGDPLADIINCAEFYSSRLMSMSFDSVTGQNSPSPIDLPGRR